MMVEVTVPIETYQPILNSITKRGGDIQNTETKADFFVLVAKVPLSNMFGFMTELRGAT